MIRMVLVGIISTSSSVVIISSIVILKRMRIIITIIRIIYNKCPESGTT